MNPEANEDAVKSGEPDTQSERPKKLKPVDVKMLKRVAKKMPFQNESAGDFIRRMRDSDRY